MVVGVERLDFMAFASAPAVLLLVAMAASLVPLRIAMRIDPEAMALRIE